MTWRHKEVQFTNLIQYVLGALAIGSIPLGHAIELSNKAL